MTRSMIRLVALAPSFVPVSFVVADVVHTNPEPDPAFLQAPEFLGVNLDGKGVDDFALYYEVLPPNCPIPEGCPTWGEARVRSLPRSAEVWITTARLSDGESVGRDRQDFSADRVVLAGFRDFQYSGPWVGEGTVGSIGVSFPDEKGNRHYGWIRVVNRNGGFDAFQMLDFAYQSTPNRPIIVGALCEADRNADGRVDSQDFFLFIMDFFSGSPDADVNGDADVTSQDFFDFMADFFEDC